MTADDAFDTIGVIGGILFSLSLAPQLYKTFRTKSADDISFVYQGIYILGITLSNIYALYFNLWPIYVPGLCEECMIIALTSMKVYFNWKNEKNIDNICSTTDDDNKFSTTDELIDKIETR